MTTTQQDAQVERVSVRADHLLYLVKLADWASGEGFCNIEGMTDPDEWCYQRWEEYCPGNSDDYSAEALATALSTASVPPQAVDAGEVDRLRAALRYIADQDDEDMSQTELAQHDRYAGYACGVRTCAKIARSALEPQAKDV